jgi:DNA-binding NarL/FixJ family response regulator
MVVQPGAPEGALAAVVSHPNAPSLTPAERDVLSMLLEGHGNAAIAHARARAQRTVANQVSGLLRKFGAHSRAELAARIAELACADALLGGLVHDAPAVASTLARLKPRQRLALTLRARGHSVKYIAYELGLAVSTVSTELKQTMQALELRSYLELCLFEVAHCACCAAACASCAKKAFSSSDYAPFTAHS